MRRLHTADQRSSLSNDRPAWHASPFGDQEPCVLVQLGRAGKKEDRNRRSRFGSGADSDSTDR
jgi:hypothetical protein